MKVTQNPLTGSTGLDKTKATDKAAAAKAAEIQANKPGAASPEASPVNISDQAILMKQARDLVYATPDTRADRVSDLKRRISDGTYSVDSAQLAEKIVDEHLASGFGKNDL
jgi:flagellar biosynthesis anti-sigma factor FlgM